MSEQESKEFETWAQKAERLLNQAAEAGIDIEPRAALNVIPSPQSDLPIGGLLGDVPLQGMLTVESDGSAAGTTVKVNDQPIRMLQSITLEVNAKDNLVLVRLEGYGRNMKIRGAIMQLQEYAEGEDGKLQDITEDNGPDPDVAMDKEHRSDAFEAV